MEKRQTKALSSLIEAKARPLKVIYISSYIPKKCGIGTFTNDLATAVNNINTRSLAEIMVIHDTRDHLEYPWETKFRIGHDQPQDYLAAAHYINQSSADVVNLQHEYGLYGGMDGDNILNLVNLLQKPLVTTFHTILPDPSEHQKEVLQQIINKSAAVVAMTTRSRTLLNQVYGCDSKKSIVIYHGIPDMTFNENERYQESLKIEADPLLLCSGLLGLDKGFEYAIMAMPKILKKFPNAKLFIVGETHPNHIRDGKEVYREILRDEIKKAGVEHAVKFIAEFLPLNELIKFHKAADFYLTPHLHGQQATSGTLSKALGAGSVCISTPYFYAKEMLADGVGVFVPFHDADAIAKAVNRVWSDEALIDKYQRNAYRVGRLMVWPSVAKRYLDLFRLVDKNPNND